MMDGVERLSVLLVGLGRVGWRGLGGAETHYASVAAHPRLTIAAGVDSDATARTDFQQATGSLVFDDMDAALADARPQLVIVATPVATHNALVHKAAFADSVRGILCEKPMALTVDECDNMRRTCYRRNKVLLIGHQRRYEQNHRLTRAFLRSGVLGAIKGGRCVFPGTDWLNNGTHGADTLRMLMGDAPYSLRLGGENNQQFTVQVACRYGQVSLESYRTLVPGYRRAMLDDLLECVDSGAEKRPECSAEDGMEAVRATLAAEAAWKAAYETAA